MNVLFLTTHFNTGGISIYVKTLAKEFKKRGHVPLVVSAGGEMVETLSSLGVEHVTMDIKTKSELSPKIYRALGKLSRLIRERKVDVVHAQTRVTQVMGTFLARMTGRPYVSTCHGFYRPKFFRKIFPCWGQGVIAISIPVVDHLRRDLNVDANKITLIHTGLDIHDFPPITEEIREKRLREMNIVGRPVIGIIARLVDIKGHDVLIKVMKNIVARYPAAKLLIVGQGKRETYLKQLVSYLGLQEHVYFYPVVNKTATMLSLLDIFVMPSLEEGLGISIMEAQAAGLPVVASRVGGIVNLIEEDKTGVLVEPGNVDELSRAVIRLLADPMKAQEFGRRARIFIEEKFSASQMAEATLRFYTAHIKDH